MQSLLLFANSGLFTYFVQSNFAGKLIVLALVAFSLVAWTLMIGKHLELKRLRALNDRFAHRISQTPRLLDVDVSALDPHQGPNAILMHSALAAPGLLEQGANKTLAVGHMENALQRSLTEQTAVYEAKMIMLGSIVSGAPFLGLLGTVWGVMDAFGALALQASASIQNLAPGVSGALLTTVAGLLVAIPSVFGYNYLLGRSKQMTLSLENFASDLADRLELELETRRQASR